MYALIKKTIFLYNAGDPETAVQTTPALFKYMRTSDLSESDKQRLIGRLEGESQSIRLEFATLVHATETELKQRNVAPKTLILKLSYYDTSLRSEFSTSETIEDIFFVANDYWSFFNYDLLEYVINIFTLTSVTLLAQYIANFQEYCKRRLCECPSDVAGSFNESGRRIVLKIDDKMSVQRSTLQDLRRLQDQASKVTGVNVMQLLKIEEGCLHLIYRIPHDSIEMINFLPPHKKLQLKEIGILSITCEKKMMRWQVEGRTFKRLVHNEEKNLSTKWVTITEMVTYETKIALSLGVTSTHVRVNAAVKLKSTCRSCDKIHLKVIPAVHRDSEARIMPCTEVTGELSDFRVPHVIPLQEIAEADPDMVEVFVELYIDSSTRPLKGTSRDTQSETDKPPATKNGHAQSSTSDAPRSRLYSLPQVSSTGCEGGANYRSRSQSMVSPSPHAPKPSPQRLTPYLMAATPTVLKTSPQRSPPCIR